MPIYPKTRFSFKEHKDTHTHTPLLNLSSCFSVLGLWDDRSKDELTLFTSISGTQKFEEIPTYNKAVMTPNKQWPPEVKSQAPPPEKLSVPSFTLPQVAPGSSTPSASSNSSCSTVRRAFALNVDPPPLPTET